MAAAEIGGFLFKLEQKLRYEPFKVIFYDGDKIVWVRRGDKVLSIPCAVDPETLEVDFEGTLARLRSALNSVPASLEDRIVGVLKSTWFGPKGLGQTALLNRLGGSSIAMHEALGELAEAEILEVHNPNTRDVTYSLGPMFYNPGTPPDQEPEAEPGEAGDDGKVIDLEAHRATDS